MVIKVTGHQRYTEQLLLVLVMNKISGYVAGNDVLERIVYDDYKNIIVVMPDSRSAKHMQNTLTDRLYGPCGDNL